MNSRFLLRLTNHSLTRITNQNLLFCRFDIHTVVIRAYSKLQFLNSLSLVGVVLVDVGHNLIYCPTELNNL